MISVSPEKMASEPHSQVHTQEFVAFPAPVLSIRGGSNFSGAPPTPPRGREATRKFAMAKGVE
jgi:hypothetical protein